MPGRGRGKEEEGGERKGEKIETEGGLTMANIKSAAAHARISKVAAARNASVKSSYRSLVRQFEELLPRDPELARKMLPLVTEALDRAAGKGVIHANTAARKKSRLASRLKALTK
jgi:small subunit ribosomal protein S20